MTAPVTLTFDNVPLTDGGTYNLGGSERTFDAWTIRLLDVGGVIVPDVGANASYLDVTSLSADTDLAGTGDNALIVRGYFGIAYAASFSSTSGAEFWLESFQIQGWGMAPAARVVGYRDGAQILMQDIDISAATQTVSLLGDGWKYIDEFRIVQRDGTTADIMFFIDDIDVKAAVLPNAAPTATNLTHVINYFEDPGTSVALDDIVVSDADAGDVITATLTLSNAAAGSLTTGTFGSATSTYNAGTGVWTVTGSVANVNAALAAVAFNPSANWDQDVTIATRIRDAAGTGPADGTITLDVTPVNDAPTLTITGNNPTYTENGAAVDLFSGVSISTVEAGQTITGLTLTVSNLADGANEILHVDGTDIALTNGTSGATAGNAVVYSVSVSGGTATVTLSSAGLSVATTEALIDGMSYRNGSDAPSTSSRVISLTSITDSGGTADGGVDTTSLSVASTVSVISVNDAPTLSGGPYSLAGTDEDTASSGTLVSAILAGLTYGDVDGPASGIALTGSTGNGTWQYSTDGLTWNLVGTISSAAALLLSASSQLRYVPDGANGEAPTLTFRAWDQAGGSASTNVTRSLADTTSNGGSTPFSTGTAQAGLTVLSVNDAPVLTPTAPVLTGLHASDIANGGQTVASMVGHSITDVDNGALEGIAITGLTSGNGTWQYSLNGTAWTDIGVVASSSALLLGANHHVRFVPDGSSSTGASLTYRAWDQTSGVAGDKFDATIAGGASAFSSATDSATIAVNGVPSVVGVTAVTSNGSYKAGDTITISVVFSEAITVTGAPQLTLETGAVDRVASFTSASANSINFLYTVQAGDEAADLDYFSATALSLNGGTITNAGGGNALLTLAEPGAAGSLGHASNIVIDTAAPTITSVDLPANKTYGTGQALDFVVKLSEAVTVSGAPRIGLTLDTGGTVFADYLSGSNTGELTFRFTVTAGLKDADGIALDADLDLNGGTLADAAGNVLTGLGLGGLITTGILIDTTATGGGGNGGNGGGGNGGGNKTTTPTAADVIVVAPSPDGTPVTVTGSDGIDEVHINGSVVLGAGLENAVLIGLGDFTVEGNALDNIIYGNAGNTTIVASAGNDFIDGGFGRNTVVFDGPAADFSVRMVGGIAEVTRLATGDVTTIANVSMLQFSDGDQALFATGQYLVAGFYEAFLGRALDQAGFEYWMSESLAGQGPFEMVQHFVNSPEFLERTASFSPQELIETLYSTFLQRPGETAGQAYWAAAIEGGMSYGDVAANFVLSLEVGLRIDELLNRNDWLGIV